MKHVHQQNQIFFLEQDQISLGRGEDADLVLPNVSISRIHAFIEKSGEDYWIRDNDSQNGFRVNQQNLTEHRLSSGDEIQIGVFSLVFLGDRLEDNYYRGRSVNYLPRYTPSSVSGNDDSTFIMSKKDKNMLLRKSGLLHNGCILMEDGRFFYPEDNPLSFGHKSAVVPVSGWYVFGTVAEISWNEKEHVLQKKSWFCPIKINGKAISSASLKIGDRITIAQTSFTYNLREGS